MQRIARNMLLLPCLTLAACLHPRLPQDPVAVEDIHQSMAAALASQKIAKAKPKKHTLPKNIADAMLPSVSERIKKQRKQERFDVAADGIAARKFFMNLAHSTHKNIVVSPELKGNISLDLRDVTLAEVLNLAQDVYGIDYERVGHSLYIMPRKLRTRIFAVNYLDVQRHGHSKTQVSSGQITDKFSTSSGEGASSSTTSQVTHPSGSTIETNTDIDFWQHLQKTLSTMVGDQGGRSVVMNPHAGLVVVKAYPSELRSVARYLNYVQANLRRQVIIDAKILEVELTDGHEGGIDWRALAAMQNGTLSFSPLSLTDFSQTNGIFTLRAAKGKYSTLIQLLNTQGNVQVLSSPRISTLNNQTAVMKVGEDEFFVTGVSTSNTIVGNNTLPSQDIKLTPFFSGISLAVTPHISNTGHITLHVHPTVSEVIDQNKQFQVSGQQQDLPLAKSSVRESDNVVTARDGDYIVIGGLMRHNTSEELASVPGAGRVPVFGSVFRHNKQNARKFELVIVLHTRLANKRNWRDVLAESAGKFHEYDRGFHVGGKPEIFGTLGEYEYVPPIRRGHKHV